MTRRNTPASSELPEGADADLTTEMAASTISTRVFRRRDPVIEDFLGRVVDLLLCGAGVGGGRLGDERAVATRTREVEPQRHVSVGNR